MTTLAELTSTKLDPDAHLILDQPLLRLPHELLRKNLKSAQRQIEITNKAVTSALSSSTNNSLADTLASLDATLAKAQGLKRKLEALQNEERQLHVQQKARIEHLGELYEMKSLSDVKYGEWSRTRLDRLLVDYMLRQGYLNAAKELTSVTGMESLADVGVFEECARIEKSLRQGRTQECLAWCAEHKQALKKVDSELEQELRLQQLIELLRGGGMKQRLEAMMYARKHLAGSAEPKFALQAAGLLAQPPDTLVEPYQTLYSPTRYPHLTTLFLRTHHTLHSLPSQPPLHIALTAGLGALKTPACHSAHALAPSVLTGAPVCPICSTELNELAKSVPYAHHTKSYMEEDPVALPNGRVFGRERLKVLNEKLGVRDGWVRDPTERGEEGGQGKVWRWDGDVRKVFIS